MRSRQGAIAVVVTVAAGVMLGACTTDDSRPSATSIPTVATTAAIDPEGAPDTGPSPTWDPTSKSGAEDVARRTMAVFVDHARDADAWWNALAPFLSSQAQQDYQGTDPSLVPARKITAAAAAVGSGSGYLATVTVPTDVGRYTLLLSRTDQGGTWHVERITPPKGLK